MPRSPHLYWHCSCSHRGLALLPPPPPSGWERRCVFETISYQDHSQIDYAAFIRFHQFLRQSFPRVFSELQVETVNDYSLLLRWPGSTPPAAPVLFTAHMDVVPVGRYRTGLAAPGLQRVVADGRIYGRGTLDDKIGLMGLLEAVERLLAQGFCRQRAWCSPSATMRDQRPRRRRGAGRRMRELGLHFAWMVDEGGMLVSDNPLLAGVTLAMVNIAEKGYLTLTLQATGRAGILPIRLRSTIGRLANALPVSRPSLPAAVDAAGGRDVRGTGTADGAAPAHGV